MYKRELDQKLQQALPKALLLYGENSYLIDFYIEYYIRSLQAEEDRLSLYFDEWDFAQAKNYLSQSSLFGGTNLLIVKHEKRIPKKELDTLIALANKNSDNYFLFGFSGETRSAKEMQRSFTEKQGGVWCASLNQIYGKASRYFRRKPAASNSISTSMRFSI